MKFSQKNEDLISNVDDPFWLLQLWLNVVYPLSFHNLSVSLLIFTPYGQ